MVLDLSQLGEINVLASQADWAWPKALTEIFRPKGINLWVATSTAEFVNIIEHRRIHTAIVDMDSEKASGLATIQIIRKDYPLLPCIILTSESSQALLDKALRLNVFTVIDKPVDMCILKNQLARLFLKKYDLDIFGNCSTRA